MVTQLSRWDNVGTEAPAGDAEYVAGQQPIAEWDNYFNWSAAKDVENLIAALENVATGHDHDGANSKQVDGSDVVNSPAGTIVATDAQAAIDELDAEKETPAGAQTKIDTHAADTSTHGVSGDIQGSEDKGVAGGIAGLDASARVETDHGGVPTGVIFPFGGAAAPTGYLLCDGAAINRTTYAALFTAIGDAYGVGDGSTTFNVPDMQGNVPVGKGGSGVTNIGDTGGAQQTALIIGTFREGGVSNMFTTIGGRHISDGSGNIENMQPYVGTEYIIKT